MLKLIGAVMIFGSCTAADAMLLALSLIGSEISCRRTPLPEIIGELAENQNPTIRLVFSGLRRRLREQNGLSLSYLWRANLRDNRAEAGLGAVECDILCEAANYLGRYDAAEQVAGLEQVGRRLSAARAAADEELRGKGNLYRTCGIALGILVILVLI